MRNRFDEGRTPDLRVVAAEYGDQVRKRMRWIGPGLAGLFVVLMVLTGLYSVEPGEMAVVRTFGKASAPVGPGLHFIVPLLQEKDVVDMANIRREEIGFRTTKAGIKLVPAEAQMLTGDENIVEVQMIVQYQVSDPVKFLFKLREPEATLHIAAEIALRGVVGQMRITSDIDEMSEKRGTLFDKPADNKPADNKSADNKSADNKSADNKSADNKSADNADAAAKDAAKPATDSDDSATKQAGTKATPGKHGADKKMSAKELAEKRDAETDILTKGRERAQIQTKQMLQKLMTLYESGIRITEVKLLPVDVPDDVQDAFHDVVRAREQREQMINKALGYRQDRIPRARGEAQKIIRAAEGYQRERVLRAEGEATRFTAILAEYAKARAVTRERLHLETMERILKSVPNKVFIDESVAKRSIPILPLGDVKALPAAVGGKR